ncbi:hypothetical protein TrLO_g11053 [Triparma laevis f. longispina]|uniref:Uncharacterized protein n=1 Tax=Triparma laevis f. longispina TaxID=1714387 RepID=A0A9W7F8H6_9STRA|nr:hypothetical protein TrLO_g11053 [Triparma laevis f. longispina]
MDSPSATSPPPAPPSTPMSLRPTPVNTTPGTDDVVDVSLASSQGATPTNGNSEVNTAAAISASLNLDEVKTKLSISGSTSSPAITIPPDPPGSPQIAPAPHNTPVPNNTPLISHIKENLLSPAQVALHNRFPQTAEKMEIMVMEGFNKAEGWKDGGLSSLYGLTDLTKEKIGETTTKITDTTNNLTAKISETTNNLTTKVVETTETLKVQVRENTKNAVAGVGNLTNAGISGAANLTETARTSIISGTRDIGGLVGGVVGGVQLRIVGGLNDVQQVVGERIVSIRIMTKSAVDKSVEVVRDQTGKVIEKTDVVRAGVEDVVGKWLEHVRDNENVEKVLTTLGEVAVRAGIKGGPNASYDEFKAKPGVEEFELSRGEEKSVTYVVKPGQTLFYEFAVQNYDVGFSLSLRTQGDGGSSESDIISFERFQSGKVERGSVGCGDLEKVFTVKFGNGYGWRGKSVSFRVSVVDEKKDEEGGEEEKVLEEKVQEKTEA